MELATEIILDFLLGLPPIGKLAAITWFLCTVILIVSAILYRPTGSSSNDNRTNVRTTDTTRSSGESNDREELRTKHKVRPLRSLEAGLKLKQMPHGTYGFLVPRSLSQDATISKNPDSSSILEIHCLPNGDQALVTFLSQEVALRLSSGSQEGTFYAYPASWEEASTIHPIKLSTINLWDSRDFDKGVVLELVVAQPN